MSCYELLIEKYSSFSRLENFSVCSDTCVGDWREPPRTSATVISIIPSGEEADVIFNCSYFNPLKNETVKAVQYCIYRSKFVLH